MKTYQKTKKLHTQRPGFTMVELMLVTLIGGVIVLAGVMGYNKIYLPVQADAEVKKIAMVIGGVERLKNSYNSGTYLPSNTQAISNIGKLVRVLGGDAATKDIGGWTYACPDGFGQTLTITIPGTSYSNTMKELIKDGFSSQFIDWGVVISSNNLVVSKSGITCK